MPSFATTKHLLRVGKARKADIDKWKEGRHLEEETRRTLEELVERAAADRYKLAATFLRDAERLARREPSHFRLAVSRYYYSMYHGMRAASFVFHGGDDFEAHRTLPGKAPDDLTGRAVWSNALKDARERRNAADYDPYPKSDTAWRPAALSLDRQARDFLREVRKYLKGKGCRYV